MRHRILSFFLAGLALLGSIISCIPMRASAMVPVGLVQSALASYIASTGYKLWNDSGTGDQILKALSDLYDGPFLAYAESVLGVNIEVNDLSYYASNDMVYLDSSSQIVIRKSAADMFQEFADWIQSNYNVTVGSSDPTVVVSQSGGGYELPSYQDTGWIYVASVADVSSFYQWAIGQSSIEFTFTGSVQSAIDTFITNHAGSIFAVQAKNDPGYMQGWSAITLRAMTYTDRFYLGNSYRIDILETYGTGSSSVSISDSRISTVQRAFPFIGFRSDYLLEACNVNAGTVAGSGGLAVSLAQAVADVIGQAQEDDAVVIGVGAGVGATAQDIADIVAQGVKAQTLDPSVSITAESVIDTPVQPYPDIDGLGLPELGAALVERFPFCIPWDFVDTVRLLNADPVAPNIAVDLFPAGFKSKVGISGSTEFRINLGDEKYAKIGIFCRWGSLIGFCFGLAILTKRMIWTA